MPPDSSHFHRAGYLLVPDLLKPADAKRLYIHARLLARKAGPSPGDPQVAGTPFFYADPAMETLLEQLTPTVERLSARRLFPTYSYFRVYKHGDELRRHVDRPACEISLSLCLGADAAGPWPLFVEGPQGIASASLNPGDGLLYKGTECPHWREPFSGSAHAQVFLHYVDQAGPHAAWKFDKRDRLATYSP